MSWDLQKSIMMTNFVFSQFVNIFHQFLANIQQKTIPVWLSLLQNVFRVYMNNRDWFLLYTTTYRLVFGQVGRSGSQGISSTEACGNNHVDFTLTDKWLQ